MKRANNKNERGYTMLEYCAGAAVIGGILLGALNILGNSTSGFLTNISTWMNNRAGDTWQPPGQGAE
jgi:Flp pilus assembly pilin Flp